LAAWRSGGGTQKFGRATKLSNSRKTFREQTPCMTLLDLQNIYIHKKMLILKERMG